MSDYIFQFDEFQSLAKKADLTIKVGKLGFVFFADNETLGNQVLGFINPKTQVIGIQVPINRKTIIDLEEFEDTEEIIDFIKEVESNFKESKKSSRKSMKESIGNGIKITNKNFEELPSWIFEDNKILKTMDEIVNTATRKKFDVVYFGDVLSGEIYIVNNDIQFIISNAGVNKDSPFCNIVIKNIEKVNEVYDYIARLPYASVYKRTDEIDEFIPNKYLKDVLDKILDFLYYWK